MSVHELTLPSTHAPADTSTGSIFFIGTATVLIRYIGLTILTDPNFIHTRAGRPGYGLSATRQTNPALEIHELPPLDLILLSHFHGDHFDQVAERSSTSPCRSSRPRRRRRRSASAASWLLIR